AVLRRVRPQPAEVVEAPPVRIDTRTRIATVAGRRLTLAQKEYDLLLCLAREPDRVFTKVELLRDVWNYQVPGGSLRRCSTKLGWWGRLDDGSPRQAAPEQGASTERPGAT